MIGNTSKTSNIKRSKQTTNDTHTNKKEGDQEMTEKKRDEILVQEEKAAYERGQRILQERHEYRATHPLPVYNRAQSLAEAHTRL